MIEYVSKLTKVPYSIDKTDIDNLRNTGFSDKDILDINLISCYFNFEIVLLLVLESNFLKMNLLVINIENNNFKKPFNIRNVCNIDFLFHILLICFFAMYLINIDSFIIKITTRYYIEFQIIIFYITIKFSFI